MTRPDDLTPEIPVAPSEAAGEAAAVTVPAAADVEKELADKLAKVQQEKENLLSALQRLQADFDNFRKRIARERADDSVRFTSHLIEALLPALDAFERAFANDPDPAHQELFRGFALIQRELMEVLGRHGLARIQAEGRPFDPHYHQAVERVETKDVPDGTVLAELRSGYLVRDRVVRPSMVRVAVAPAGVSADQQKVN